jgi:hypothetical protein
MALVARSAAADPNTPDRLKIIPVAATVRLRLIVRSFLGVGTKRLVQSRPKTQSPPCCCEKRADRFQQVRNVECRLRNANKRMVAATVQPKLERWLLIERWPEATGSTPPENAVATVLLRKTCGSLPAQPFSVATLFSKNRIHPRPVLWPGN